MTSSGSASGPSTDLSGSASGPSNDSSSGAELLGERLASIPDAMRLVLRSPPALALPEGRVVVTGVGASEGPARALVAALSRAGRVCARYAPLSAFFDARAGAADETLVVFSQQLSPNARMALASAPRFRRTILFTSSAAPPPNVEAIVLPPASEEGALLRIVGPAVAAFAAVVWVEQTVGDAGAMQRLAAVPGAVDTASARVRDALAGASADVLARPVAFVASGDGLEAYRGVATKWLEGTGTREPPVWDVMAVPHGPFHQLVDDPTTFVTLEPAPESAAAVLFDRLESMIVPHGHSILRLRSSLSGPHAVFDHDALVDALLVRALEIAPHDLRYPRTAGLDAPLYAIDRPPAEDAGR